MQEKAARRAAERRIAVPRMKYITPVKPVTSWDEVPVIFDISMASRLLGKSRDWISRRCQKGLLPAFKDGSEWRFEKDAFRDYIRQNRTGSHTNAN